MVLDSSFWWSVIWWVLWWIFTLGWVWLTINRQSNQMKKEREITYKKEEFLQLKKSYEDLLENLPKVNLIYNKLFTKLENSSVNKEEINIEFLELNKEAINYNQKILWLISLYFPDFKDRYKTYSNIYNDLLENVEQIDVSEIKGYKKNLNNLSKKLYDEILDDYNRRKQELDELLKK